MPINTRWGAIKTKPGVAQRQEKRQWVQIKKKKKICSNTKNHIFTVMVGKYCKRFPREVVESPSLEILKTLLAMALDNLL